jgi:hypothetical protein
MDIIIKKVETKKQLNDFINSQWNFYSNDENFVPPVKADRRKLLDVNKNPFFKHSEIAHFLAYEGDNITGRISAIINHNHNKTHNDKIGFFGFFECINNQKTANLLFYEAEKWLKSKGMNKVRGPLNPSINDEIALLIDGFNLPPVVLMTYNPKYYIELIENAGYYKEKDLYAYLLNYESYMTDKLKRVQNIVRKKYDVSIREVDFKHKEQFGKDVETLKNIYNKAWEKNWGAVKMTDEEFDFLAKDLKQIATPELTFILEIKGKPAGFLLAIPDINQILKDNKSGSIISAGWKLLTRRKQINTVRILVLGLLEEYRNLGADAVLYYEIGHRAKSIGCERAEASWILEDNEMMNKALTKTMNAEIYKKYRIFEKEL